MIITGVLGVVVERVFYRRLTRGGGGYTVAGMGMIICGFGMSVALQNVAYLLWGAAPHPYPVSFGMPIFLGNIALPRSYLYILICALVADDGAAHVPHPHQARPRGAGGGLQQGHPPISWGSTCR